MIFFREPGKVGAGKINFIEWTYERQLERISRAVRNSTVTRIGFTMKFVNLKKWEYF
ncbi:hypothetical protein J27TS8_09570 [Robertmurraya siralis]|uniref:Uncharacterized protein n=1 Tax=Robertmurraya siralis TaxID=77777 RepID=A0A920BSP1_9BACI|nr:hypothetical protein J27TS8_09570 [Robertmurraya siralis]